MKIGNYIRLIKEEREFDSGIIAKILKISEEEYNDLENGESDINLDQCLKLCSIYDIEFNDFLNRDLKKLMYYEIFQKEWIELNLDTRSLIIANILHGDRVNSENLTNIINKIDSIELSPHSIFNAICNLESISLTSICDKVFDFKFGKLSFLFNIISIKLEKCSIDGFCPISSLRNLNLTNTEIIKIETLRELENVQVLILKNSNITNLEHLTTWKYLSELYIYKDSDCLSDQVNLKDINKLTSLKKLHLPTGVSSFPKEPGYGPLICTSVCISDLSNLKVLTFKNNIRGGDIKLNFLSSNKNLEKLITYNCNSLYINNLAKLKHLEIYGDNVVMSEILNLRRLEYLKISGYFASSKGLAGIKSLKYLEISNADRKILEQISNLTNLEEVNILSDYAEKIDGIKNLEKLTKLILHTSKIRDYSEIGKLKYLEILEIDSEFIERYTSLRLSIRKDEFFIDFKENYLNLKDLTVVFQKLKDIEVFKILENLERLNLSKNNIENLKYLERLVNIKELDLSYNYIEDISVLRNLSKLERLNLSNNSICDMSALQNLTSLKHLNISSNKIESVSDLKNLSNIEFLDISGNIIEQVKDLERLNKLSRLVCSTDNIKDISILQNSPLLNKVEIIRISPFKLIIENSNSRRQKERDTNKRDILYNYSDGNNDEGPYCPACQEQPCRCSDPGW